MSVLMTLGMVSYSIIIIVSVYCESARQLCGSYGENKNTYHDVDGTSVIDTNLFPDFKAMTTYAHNLGLTAGCMAFF
jgi:hypothetical protein